MNVIKGLKDILSKDKTPKLVPQRTKYFVNCKGIFQGGGAKAIAYVGAYEKAIERGVGFSEFAGTSAGSMIAALLAAGATPQQLKKIIATTDFSPLKPKRDFKGNRKARVISKIINWFGAESQVAQKIGRIVTDLGLYDSSPIIGIMESALHKITNRDGDVLFEHMKYPLTIVAVDLVKHEKVVWSTKNTPTAKVVDAVRASCNIPFWFIPMSGRYVDGGMLCNLPVTEFLDTSYDFDPLLAFSFEYNNPNKKNNGIKNFLYNLANSVVHGASEIQKKLVGEIPLILINTNVNMLDFDKLKGTGETGFIRNAYKQGADAMTKFLDKENSMEFGIINRVILLKSKEQVSAQVSYYSITPTDVIVISLPDMVWVYSMFLYLIKWKRDRCEIAVFTEKLNGKQLRILNHLGIRVSVSNSKLPAYGYFFKKSSIWSGISIKCNDKGAINLAKNLNSEMDSCIIESIIYSLYSHSCRDIYPQPFNGVSIVKDSESVYSGILKSIPVFKSATISYENVKLSDLKLMRQYVAGYQYRAMSILEELYGSIDFCDPISFELANGRQSRTVPVIVIEIDGELIVVKGNVRVLYCYKKSLNKIRAIVVRDFVNSIKHQLLYSLQDVIITDRSATSVNTTYQNIDNALRRQLIEAYQPQKTYLR